MPWIDLEYMNFASVVYYARGEESWYPELLAYFKRMYPSIERRLMDTFRFVDCHPDNAKSFSYEYGSILRDAGSCFGSVMDRLVKGENLAPRNLDIRDYTEWLSKDLVKFQDLNLKPLDNIALAGAEITSLLDKRLLRKFLPHLSHGRPPRWWNAYNNVKHSDLDHYQDGSLENCLNAVAALACLWIFCEAHDTTIQLFRRIGLFSPKNFVEERTFCKEDVD